MAEREISAAPPPMSITEYPEAIEAIDAILRKRGTAEIKLEGRGSKLVVVETSRQVKTTTPVNEAE